MAGIRNIDKMELDQQREFARHILRQHLIDTRDEAFKTKVCQKGFHGVMGEEKTKKEKLDDMKAKLRNFKVNYVLSQDHMQEEIKKRRCEAQIKQIFDSIE